ncbi:DUF4755 domain-containing protein [Sinimarinibacterium sp. CAU 1509]|uniref:DUF4755 domain-containing protein n=1 Tax=Sinimarinibacterium sp. CAU 1509 TaxID=2562283 RepID=UPI0010ABD414|nr:DUF4755 domain-containing protein [Sinimarinibacterium sp. CAU 1509]TJY58307.1 DUF4755 domain-containing protein [Sinimarinibacterium sp. CAU 1509]
METLLTLFFFNLLPAFIVYRIGKSSGAYDEFRLARYGWPIFGFILSWLGVLIALIAGRQHKPRLGDNSGAWITELRPDQVDYSYTYDGDGIAISASQRAVVLKKGTLIKRYGFDAIRNWETKVNTGNELINADFRLNSISQTDSINRKIRMANEASSGLFIEVRDIDHPRWHIRFSRHEMVQQVPRWMEILRQLINESQHGDNRKAAQL